MKNIFKKIVLLTFVLLMVFSPNLTQAQLGPDDDPFLYENNNPGGGSNSGSPNSTFSCSLGTNPKIQNLFDYISCIINLSVIPLVFSLAFMLFVYGVVQYVLNDTDGAKREKGKQFMIWGIIALTVMVSTWGLVRVLGSSFGLNTSFIPKVSPN
jgi:hypothetical protein